MQSHEHQKIDARAIKWLDGEIEYHPERFRVERFDGKTWNLVE